MLVTQEANRNIGLNRCMSDTKMGFSKWEALLFL
jgi:hypothetical protein